MISFDFKHFTKHKLKDAFNNMLSSFKAWREYRSYNGNARMVFPPEGYNTVFEDKFDKRLDLNEWRYGQAWGDFHPGFLHQYYDNDGTLTYTSHDGLVLELRKIPKSWKKADLPDWRTNDQMPDEFTIPVGVGMISSLRSWQHGWFEAWIKLPKGQKYWPAFWLSGVDTWPPEIDILEGYSHKGNEYADKKFGKMVKNLKIQPNIHYGRTEEGSKKMYGAWDVPVADATDRFVQYACLWEHDRIEIYYDGLKVFECTDPEILKWFNASDARQNVIFNHGLHYEFPENPNESAMVVRSFRVCQR